jgi:hypothetical protein
MSADGVETIWLILALAFVLLVLKYVIKPVPSLFLLFPVGVVGAVDSVAVGPDASADVQLVQFRVVAMAAVTADATSF